MHMTWLCRTVSRVHTCIGSGGRGNGFAKAVTAASILVYLNTTIQEDVDIVRQGVVRVGILDTKCLERRKGRLNVALSFRT